MPDDIRSALVTIASAVVLAAATIAVAASVSGFIGQHGGQDQPMIQRPSMLPDGIVRPPVAAYPINGS